MMKSVDEYPPSKFKRVDFRSIPNLVPTPSEMNKIRNIIRDDDDIKAWDEAHKQSYALAFDIAFRIHAKDHFEDHIKGGPWAQKRLFKKTKGGRDLFIHMFGFPLFKMVAANWARVVVRRSFDLDLLEWRSKEHLSSTTINEIKSRRLTIGRHQRDIAASLEVLRGLMLEERGEVSDTTPQWNRGRSNGFATDAADDDSWSRIYFDFFELKASMDALETRADKIQEGMVGLISVWNGEETSRTNESASILNKMAFVFSVILLPFSIVGPIFGADLIPGGPSKKLSTFLKAMFSTFAAVLATFVFLVFVLLYRELDHIRPLRVSKIRTAVQNLIVIWERKIKSQKQAIINRCSTVETQESYRIPTEV